MPRWLRKDWFALCGRLEQEPLLALEARMLLAFPRGPGLQVVP